MDVAVGASAIRPAALFTLHVATTLNIHVTRFKWMPFPTLWSSSRAATATAVAARWRLLYEFRCALFLFVNVITEWHYGATFRDGNECLPFDIIAIFMSQHSWRARTDLSCNAFGAVCVCVWNEGKTISLLSFHSVPIAYTRTPAITSPSKLIAVTRSKIPIALTGRSHEHQTPWASSFGPLSSDDDDDGDNVLF